LAYRRQVDAGRLPESEFRMPGAPAANWFALAFLAMVLVLLAFNKDTVIALYVAPVWVAIMVVGYFASRSHHVGTSRRPAAPVPHA
jgi:amino acid transporter, AAT family